MKKQKKQQNKTRQMRVSDKTWDEFEKQKIKSGKNWDKFIVDVNNLLQVKK